MENVCEVEGIKGLEWVVFNDSFNEKLSPQILDLIARYKKVQFGTAFNQPIDNLPECVTHIQFKDTPYDKIDALVPEEIHKSHFNQPVNNLPSSLIFLMILVDSQQID